MGLDNYWRIPGEPEDHYDPDVHPEFDPPLHLCGGMFSGHGTGSFRGKVYNGIVEAVTGVSLYTEEIPNETIQEMATKLEEQPTPGGVVLAEWDITPDEYEDLARMFRGYADAGASLASWY